MRKCSADGTSRWAANSSCCAVVIESSSRRCRPHRQRDAFICRLAESLPPGSGVQGSVRMSVRLKAPVLPDFPTTRWCLTNWMGYRTKATVIAIAWSVIAGPVNAQPQGPIMSGRMIDTASRSRSRNTGTAKPPSRRRGPSFSGSRRVTRGSRASFTHSARWMKTARWPGDVCGRADIASRRRRGRGPQLAASLPVRPAASRRESGE